MKLYKQSRLLIWGIITGIIFLVLLQSIWIYHIYGLERFKLTAEIKEAFSVAYEKEQTYRIPLVDIVSPGELSIQSCGNEEIIIVRRCSNSDTIVYNNTSGYSIENFISHVFYDLRENIVPMNIQCLSDLFAGMLHEKDILLPFTIDRYNVIDGTILETTSFIGNKQIKTKNKNIIASQISDSEAIRAVMDITPKVILRKMSGTLLCTFCLVIIVLGCLIFLCKNGKQHSDKKQIKAMGSSVQNNTFIIGKYRFNPQKNELEGFGEIIQLNKKENTILYALCIEKGNVVERNFLLTENWGNSGMIYSRSLDTYIATLRKYLKKDPDVQIVTVKGVGYKLAYNEL